MSEWLEAAAPAKLNLALVVGSLREDGKQEVVTVVERLSLADRVAMRRATETQVLGVAGLHRHLAGRPAVVTGAPCRPRRP